MEDLTESAENVEFLGTVGNPPNEFYAIELSIEQQSSKKAN